jgi:hypothetical protein
VRITDVDEAVARLQGIYSADRTVMRSMRAGKLGEALRNA